MIDHTMGHKTRLNKFKRVEIIQNTFFGHNATNLDISNTKISRKSPNI